MWISWLPIQNKYNIEGQKATSSQSQSQIKRPITRSMQYKLKGNIFKQIKKKINS